MPAVFHRVVEIGCGGGGRHLRLLRQRLAGRSVERRCRWAGPAGRRWGRPGPVRPLAVCACGAYAVVDCLASCVSQKYDLGYCLPSSLAGSRRSGGEDHSLERPAGCLTEIVARKVRYVVWGRPWANARGVCEGVGIPHVRHLACGLSWEAPPVSFNIRHPTPNFLHSVSTEGF